MQTASKSTRPLLRTPVDDALQHIDPEAALCAALIRGAIRDWINYRQSSRTKFRKIAESARRWLFDESHEPNSLLVFCHGSGLEPEVVRKRAKQEAIAHLARNSGGSSRI